MPAQQEVRIPVSVDIGDGDGPRRRHLSDAHVGSIVDGQLGCGGGRSGRDCRQAQAHEGCRELQGGR